MAEHFIGIDVGTGSARAGVFDATGKLLASAKAEIRIWREPGDIVEQSSDDIWRAVCNSVREALAAAAIDPISVAGIGFDRQVCNPGGDFTGAQPLGMDQGMALAEHRIVTGIAERSAARYALRGDVRLYGGEFE